MADEDSEGPDWYAQVKISWHQRDDRRTFCQKSCHWRAVKLGVDNKAWTHFKISPGTKDGPSMQSAWSPLWEQT